MPALFHAGVAILVVLAFSKVPEDYSLSPFVGLREL